MALSTEEAAYNTALDTAIAALETLIESYSVGDKLYLVPIKPGSDEHQGYGKDSAARFEVRDAQIYTVPVAVANEAKIPLTFQGKPVFYKVTNAAGDTS